MSATHDFNADAFYIIALRSDQQAFFVGWRSASYMLGRLVAQGGTLLLVGLLQHIAAPMVAWQIGYGVAALLLLTLACYHCRVLPSFSIDYVTKTNSRLKGYFMTLRGCLTQDGIVIVYLLVLLTFFGQMQVNKILPLFLLGHHQGLSLSTLVVGEIYGIFGTAAMIMGCVLGGMWLARWKLQKLLVPLLCLMAASTLPLLIFSSHLSHNLYLLAVVVMVNQFCFGLTVAAQMMVMIRWANQSDHTASAYAIIAAVMVGGLMLAGLIAGTVQQLLGYSLFFIVSALAILPAILLAVWALHKKVIDGNS